MSDNADSYSSPERRVKAFLDACGYILLRDNHEGTLTDYKDIMSGKREIPVSSCPEFINDLLESSRQPPSDEGDNGLAKFALMLEKLDARAKPYETNKRQKRPVHADNRFSRIERIKAQHPGCTFTFCRIDTMNRFEFSGIWYAIDETITAYQPKQTKEGVLYDMDEICVVQDFNGKLNFYDQQMFSLNRDGIHYA